MELKNCRTQILIAVLVTGLITYFLTKEFSPEYEVLDKKTDTTLTVTTKITETENTFTSEQVGNIKKVLIDSLGTIYRNKINRLMEDGRWKMEGTEGEDNTTKKDYAYVSEIDSNFVAVDESGEVTDSMHITSTFLSPDPLPENSLHLLMIKHKSSTKEIFNERTIITTETIVKKKSFWERFKIIPNISAGVGLINKQFDIYAGVGIGYEL